MNSKEMTEIQLEELKKAMELTIEQSTMQVMMQAMEPILAPIMAAFQKQDVEIQELKAEINRLREQPPASAPTKTRITLFQAAELLGKAVTTIRTLAQSGKIPSHKVGKHRLYYKEDLIEWMNSTPEEKEKKQDSPIETPESINGRPHPKFGLAPSAPKQRRRAKAVNI